MSIVSSGQITITDLSDGDDGVGVTSTVITYANSTSGTTAPSTGWTSSVPTLIKGQYLWTKTVWTYTDTSSKTGYSVSYNSKDGTNGTDGTSGIIVSSVAPASPQNGQLWQDSSTTPQLVKKWTGSSWVIWELYVENMNVNNLSALSPNLGNITGGSYTSWNVSNGPVYDYLNGVYIANGRVRSLTIENPSSTNPDDAGVAINKYVRGTQSFAGTTEYYMATVQTTQTANQLLKSSGGMDFWSQLNDTGGYCGQITAENVTLVPWTNLKLNSGYKAGDGMQPQYRRIKNLDGSCSVQFRGAVSPTSGNFPTGQVTVATLSGVYLPPTIAMRQGSDNTGRGARVAITTAGNLVIMAPNTSSYVYIDVLTYIN